MIGRTISHYRIEAELTKAVEIEDTPGSLHRVVQLLDDLGSTIVSRSKVWLNFSHESGGKQNLAEHT